MPFSPVTGILRVCCNANIARVFTLEMLRWSFISRAATFHSAKSLNINTHAACTREYHCRALCVSVAWTPLANTNVSLLRLSVTFSRYPFQPFCIMFSQAYLHCFVFFILLYCSGCTTVLLFCTNIVEMLRVALECEVLCVRRPHEQQRPFAGVILLHLQHCIHLFMLRIGNGTNILCVRCCCCCCCSSVCTCLCGILLDMCERICLR